MMPRLDGLDVQGLRARGSTTPILMLTASPPSSTACSAWNWAPTIT